MRSYLAAVIVVAFAFVQIDATSKNSALRQSIFNGYDKLVKPDESVVAKFGISLLNIHICPEKQVLTSDSWLKIFWSDSRLKWNPADWNGIEQLNIDASEVWVPDVVLYNGEQVKKNHITFTNDKPKVIVMSTGDVLYVPPVTHTSFCAVDAQQKESGSYTCNLKFGSWTYHKDLVDIVGLEDPATKQVPIDTNDFFNPDVKVTSTSVVRNEVKYDCCPDFYPNLFFTISFTQKSNKQAKTEL